MSDDYQQPIEYIWTGTVMEPAKRFVALARNRYTVGARYFLSGHEERSSESHRHLFACIRRAFDNLPEERIGVMDFHHPEIVKYQSPEHLRKRALIVCHYANERNYVCTSNEEASRWALMLSQRDEYAIIKVHGKVIKEWTAKSLATGEGGMSRAEFERCKADMLALLAGMIGVSVAELSKQGSDDIKERKTV